MKQFIQLFFSLLSFYVLVVLIQLFGVSFHPYSDGYWAVVFFVLGLTLFSASVTVLYEYFKTHQLERILMVAILLFDVNYFIQAFFLEVAKPIVIVLENPIIELRLLFKSISLTDVYLTELNEFLTTAAYLNALVVVGMIGAMIYQSKRVSH